MSLKGGVYAEEIPLSVFLFSLFPQASAMLETEIKSRRSGTVCRRAPWITITSCFASCKSIVYTFNLFACICWFPPNSLRRAFASNTSRAGLRYLRNEFFYFWRRRRRRNRWITKSKRWKYLVNRSVKFSETFIFKRHWYTFSNKTSSKSISFFRGMKLKKE